jgi:hypothetical protein
MKPPANGSETKTEAVFSCGGEPRKRLRQQLNTISSRRHGDMSNHKKNRMCDGRMRFFTAAWI